MHIIIKTRLVDFWNQHPDAQPSLRLWFKRVRSSRWRNFNELRKSFPSADSVKNLTVFNVGGNKYRLITLVDCKYQKVFIRAVLTHAEYDKEGWKNDSWFK